MKYDACRNFLKFGFVESAFESLASEIEIAVFLHVEVDEFPGAVELAETGLDGRECAFLIEKIDLREDRGDFHREVLALGFGEEFEILLEAVLRFFFSENGFTEKVQVDLGTFFEVGGERFFFAGEDDALAFRANLRGDGGHHNGGKEAGGKGSETHENAFVRAKVIGDAVGFDEAAEGFGLGGCAGRAEDFVCQVEGEFLTGRVGEETCHLGGFLFLDGVAGRSEKFGGEFAGAINKLG